MARVIVVKDRPGFVRQVANAAGVVGELHLASNEDGSVAAELRPPAAGAFRPTILMQRVSQALESAGSELSQRGILDRVRGKREAVVVAIDCLVSEGFVATRPHGQAVLHSLLRPFIDDEQGEQ